MTTAPESDTARPGRRERRRQELRDRICTAALALFREHGFEAVTMAQIAERADVARATVFNHFPQKTAFLEEWGARRRARVAEILDRAHAADLPAPDRLHRYLVELGELNETSRAETAVLMAASAHFGNLLQDPPLAGELARIIAEGQHRAELRPAPDPAEAGALLAAGYFAAVLTWAAPDPPPFPLVPRLERTLTLVLDGLR